MGRVTINWLIFSVMISLVICSHKFQSADEKIFRFDQNSKEISAFLNTKNILKTLLKLFFGNNEESTATSKQMLNVLVKVLDMFKTSFGKKARSTNQNLRDDLDDATLALVSIFQGYVKSVLAEDEYCAQRYLCESSKQAIRDGREFGYVITQLGGYASSYFLENQKSTPFNRSFDAILKGRNGENCTKLYSNCNEAN